MGLVPRTYALLGAGRYVQRPLPLEVPLSLDLLSTSDPTGIAHHERDALQARQLQATASGGCVAALRTACVCGWPIYGVVSGLGEGGADEGLEEGLVEGRPGRRGELEEEVEAGPEVGRLEGPREEARAAREHVSEPRGLGGAGLSSDGGREAHEASEGEA